MMTRKDYEKAADITRWEWRNGGTGAQSVEDAFVTFFRGDNPRFDEKRFREACKPIQKEKK